MDQAARLRLLVRRPFSPCCPVQSETDPRCSRLLLRIDGIRIDTVKHVRKDFWPSFTAASGVYALGEVLDGSVDYIAPYTEVMDGIFSYAVYYQSLYAFANPGGSMATLAETYNDMAAASKDMSLLGTFLDNHDQPRYASTTKDLQANANAAAWSFVTDGIPIVYYGQEQGFTGGADPANRGSSPSSPSSPG